MVKPVQAVQPALEKKQPTPAIAPQKPGRLPRTLEAKTVSAAELEARQTQQLEVQRSRDLELREKAVQRAQLERQTTARVTQTKVRSAATRSLSMQRAVSEHLQSARATQVARDSFIAQRSAAQLNSELAERLEAEVRPPLEPAVRQADLTLSHVADHTEKKAVSQISGNPDAIRNLQGFKNAGATLVRHFRAPDSRHTMPQLAGAIQRFRDPWQRAAVEASAYAAFGHHPTFPQQLQRALDEQDHHLELQREAWRVELEPTAQRMAEQEASGQGAAGLIEAARGGGQPLPAGVRAMLETKWNTDLSKVRVHTDSSADVVSKKLNAKALTSGSDIFFRAGGWNPTSLEGLQLIAHETWHTVQQANGRVQAGVDKSASLELEARGKGAELSSNDLNVASSGAGLKTRSSRTPKPATTARTSSSTKVAQRTINTATPTPASGHSTSTRQVGNLDGLSASAPIFGAPVQRATDGTVIQRAWWNPFDWAKDAAGWLGEQFMHGLEWMGEKAAKVFMEVFAAAAKPFGATGKMVLEAIRNIGKPLLSILENPGRFASNLIGGVKQGFMGFAEHAPQHLTGVLGSFLGGKGLSLTFPTKLEPLPILMAFITTLNLGWDGIKAKIAKQLGPKGHQALALAEQSVPMVKQLSGGLHNSSEFTKEVLPTLKTQAVDGVKSAAQEGLIRAGINALLKLIPGAGTVMAIFDTVRVLIERAKDISSLVTNVMGAFGAIAGGNVVSAAMAVETSLVSGIRIALNFVAKLAKIDSFIDRVRGIIGKVTTKISSVVDPLIAKAVKMVKPLLSKLGGKGDPKGKAPTSSKPGVATPKPTRKPSAAQTPIRDGVVTAKMPVTGDKVPHHVWAEIKGGQPVLMMASTPMQIIDHLKGLKAEARAKLDQSGADYKTVEAEIGAAGGSVAKGIAQMRTQLRTRTNKPQPNATSTSVKAINKLPDAFVGIATNTLERVRSNLQRAFPILAKANGGVLPSVGEHPLKAANRESHHVPAAELAEVIQGQYRAVAAQLAGNTAAPVKGLHDALVQHAAAIEPVTSTRGNGLTAILIHKDTHRECKLGNAVHKTFLADAIRAQVQRDLQPNEKRVVMVITPKGKRKRIEVNPQNGAWQAFLKGVHDIEGVTGTRGTGELVEVTANPNALNEVAAIITRRLQSAPAGGLAPTVVAIRTRINTLTQSAFAQARNNGVSAVRAALAHSTKDGDHARHEGILSNLVAQSNSIWNARVLQTL